MRILFLIFLSVILSDKPLPRFDQYSVEIKFKSKPIVVDLKSHPRAKMFRTILRNAASEGPNFADHYRIVRWGCGTSCIEYAVIDLSNGKVFISPKPAVTDLVFHLDSRLLVVNPIDSLTFHEYGDRLPEYVMTRYLVWEKNKFTQIDSTMKPVEFIYKSK